MQRSQFCGGNKVTNLAILGSRHLLLFLTPSTYQKKMTDSPSQVQAVTLVTIDTVLAAQQYQGETIPMAAGPCQVLLVATDSSVQDAYLMLSIAREEKLEDYEIVLSNDQQITSQSAPQGNKYSIKSSEIADAWLDVTLPPAATASGQEEAFVEILEQYCGFSRPASGNRATSGDSKGTQTQGQIELVDETGQVFGTLDESIQPDHKGDGSSIIAFDDSSDRFYDVNETIGASGSQQPPGAFTQQPQDKDWLINGAHYVSKTLVTVGSWVGGSVDKAAGNYVTKGSNQAQAGGQPGTGQGYSQDVNRVGSQSSSSSSHSVGQRNINVHPSINKGLEALATGSGHVVKLSGSARKKILDASEGTGRRIGGVRKNKDGTQREPGTIRKQIQRGANAVNIVLDGFDTAVGGVVNSVTSSSTSVMQHKYGDQAAKASSSTGTVGRNCFLVYKDISGIRRKCLLKLAGGTLKGRTADGQEIVIQPQSTGEAMERDYVPASSSSTAASQGVSKKVPSPAPTGDVPPPNYYDEKKR
ncbi:unnamed protein product [Sympodiomycopsis kandeliae]